MTDNSAGGYAVIDETVRARLEERVASRVHPDGPARVHDSHPVPPPPREVDQLLDAAAEARLALFRPTS